MFSNLLNEFSGSEFRCCTLRARHRGAGRLNESRFDGGRSGLGEWHPASMRRPAAAGAKRALRSSTALFDKALGWGNAGFPFLLPLREKVAAGGDRMSGMVQLRGRWIIAEPLYPSPSTQGRMLTHPCAEPPSPTRGEGATGHTRHRPAAC